MTSTEENVCQRKKDKRLQSASNPDPTLVFACLLAFSLTFWVLVSNRSHLPCSMLPSFPDSPELKWPLSGPRVSVWVCQPFLTLNIQLFLPAGTGVPDLVSRLHLPRTGTFLLMWISSSSKAGD